MALHTDQILSLFSGVGGLDLGVSAALKSLGRAPRTVCMVEGEAFGAACLAAQMEAGRLDPAPIWSDVRTFDARPWRGLVSGVVGGFPCQDLSFAGNGAGIRGERSGLFWQLARIVRELEPRWVFLENVAAITVRGLDAVLGELASLGYDAEWCCLRASDVGAPHRRDRWFCLAYRDGLEWQRECGANAQPDWRNKPEGCGESVAHPDGARSQGVAGPEQPRPTERDARREGRALDAWPPGPDDLDAWRRVLAERPDLAPAQPRLRRVADGISDRVDRLRALGNAVVPAQAEQAFVELWRRSCVTTESATRTARG